MKSLFDYLTFCVVACVILLSLSVEAHAQFMFGPPERLGDTINGVGNNWETNVSSDDLSLFFYSNRGGGGNIWESTRDGAFDAWGTAAILEATVSATGFSGSPDITTDGRTLFFNSDQSDGLGDRDIWMINRPPNVDEWGPAVNLGSPINSNAFEGWPTISKDQRSLYYTTSRNVDNELVVSQRPSLNAPWGEPQSLGVVGGTADISSDGLALFFTADGPFGGNDIWVMTRESENEQFGEPILLPEPINTSGDDFSPNISDDGATFYFYSRGAVWQAAVVPEPSTSVSLILGLVGLVGSGFRRPRGPRSRV